MLPAQYTVSLMDRIGRYKIVRELGRGAMGVVYLATDPTIGRPVAIKTIRLGEVSNAEERARLRERLFREARSAGVLSHPGIVTIYDMEAQDDLAYIAMEYVNGPTLDQLISGQPLPADRMFAILAKPRWPSITPTRRASCIATSSPPTSWSPRTARPRSRTSASPKSAPTSSSP